MEEFIINGIKVRMHPDCGNMTFSEAVRKLCDEHKRIIKLIEVSKFEAIIEILKAIPKPRRIKVDQFGAINDVSNSYKLETVK